MRFAYDDDNIFARILRGEIPNDTVAENDHALAFRDIAPKAPSHVLVIPKGRYVSFEDFAAHGTEADVAQVPHLTPPPRTATATPSSKTKYVRIIKTNTIFEVDCIIRMATNSMAAWTQMVIAWLGMEFIETENIDAV